VRQSPRHAEGLLGASRPWPRSPKHLVETWFRSSQAYNRDEARRIAINIAKLWNWSGARTFVEYVAGVGLLSGPTMFRLPAYDPVALAVMGLGILLAAALALSL
jgi:hypothetical protein